MKALVKRAPGRGHMDLAEVERPVPGPGEVLMKVRASGICGSDLHVYEGELGCKTPVIPGHEFSGEVSQLGPDVDGWAIEDAVVSELHVGVCGKCYYCSNGLSHLCLSKTAVGWGVDGGFAEYAKVPARLLHRIPEGVSFRVAALTEPLAIAVYSILERANLKEGDRVAVIGCGPVGLLSAIVCRQAGASWVGIVGRSKRGTLRLSIAGELGLDAVIDSCHTDPVSVVRDVTDGVGADVVVEAAGSDEAIGLSMQLLRRDGSLVALGITPADRTEFPWNDAMIKVMRVVFSWSSTRSSWDKALGIMQSASGQIEKLVTHELPLAEWERGFQLLKNREAIKCLFVP